MSQEYYQVSRGFNLTKKFLELPCHVRLVEWYPQYHLSALLATYSFLL
ncbi:hypothetical protein CPter91_0239 [Collimonas pratensis]|uniref:Uncharacterized protein n=1 Tax=Collimonas pratensis TaxID=279113 RepID=A0A127PXU7_9BURK|nr:hypothetical protein CPter91_0239 [Collimonas pratensis]